MKLFLIALICLFAWYAPAQAPEASEICASSLFKDIANGDSVTVYQCHVEDAVQQLTTASGQTITGKSQKYTLTEKYVLVKTPNGYDVRYCTSTLSVFPNRKFSGLKIRERPYWNFTCEKKRTISEQDLKVFLALEKRGREAIEYDFAISRHTTNQIIIKKRKNFKQLVIEGNYVISKLIRL